jgi:hypothetical protein
MKTKISCLKNCFGCEYCGTYTMGDGGTVSDYYDCDLIKKHFDDDDLPFPKWCPLPDVELNKKIEKQDDFNPQEESLNILNAYLSIAVKMEPINLVDKKFKDDKQKEIMEEMRFLSNTKLSKEEAMKYLKNLVF